VNRVRNGVIMSACPSDVSAFVTWNNKIFYEIWGGGGEVQSERSATNFANAETHNGDLQVKQYGSGFCSVNRKAAVTKDHPGKAGMSV
jgi:hypothetical protein